MSTGSFNLSNDNTTTMVDPTPFHTLQSSFNAARRARPPAMPVSSAFETDERVPLRLQRQLSKGGLRGIFKRTKAEKSLISSVQEEDRMFPAAAGSSTQEAAAKSLPQYLPAMRSSNKLESSPITPQKPASKTSHLNLKSLKQTKMGTKAGAERSPKSSTKAPTWTSTTWDPPPLFQAYPQAIKHAQLSASTLTADAILRISQNKKTSGLIREVYAQTTENEQGQTAAARKTEKAKSKHRRQISGSISGAGWTQKVFVLVTSGYLLQYSGDGSFDRLPEKMMQLGKDSVAFASDVLPGKHWVLQISQAMDADGAPTADSRSLFSRLSFRGADYRRTTTSILLVLNSAEEMDSWLAVLRREIEALGGKKHVSETGNPNPNDNIMQLRAQPSHRYLDLRATEQMSNPPSPKVSSFAAQDYELQVKLNEVSQDQARPRSFSRPLTGHESVANSIVSHDGRQLDSLRDSTPRLSYISSGTRESTSTLDEFPLKVSIEDIRPNRPNALAISERRRSMQTLQIAVIDEQPAPYRPHSTFGVPTRPARPQSPPMTPNFSVPFPSPKRFPSQQNTTIDVPPIPILTASMSSNNTLKLDRKLPPAALIMNRPLSPVDNFPFVETLSPNVNLTNDYMGRNAQTMTSVMNITPHTSKPSTVHLESRDTSILNFQFPRRHSSMQELRDAVDGLLEYPELSPLSKKALKTPLPPSPTHSAPKAKEREKNEDLSSAPSSITGHKACRPASMQVHSTSSAISISKSPKLVGDRPSSSLGFSKTPRPGAKSPSGRRLKVSDSSKGLGNRRSMPLLSTGPPPAPPPTMALPPLPPASGGLKSPMRLSMSVKV